MVLTCDGIAGKIVMYVNGVAGVTTTFIGDVLTANYDLTLGWGHTSDAYHYNGLIDEVKIYNRVLSPQEIEAKYNHPESWSYIAVYPNPSSCGDTLRLAYWAMDDDEVELHIYNEMGREVNRITDLSQSANYNEIVWDGKDRDGKELSPGIYRAILFKTGSHTILKGLL